MRSVSILILTVSIASLAQVSPSPIHSEDIPSLIASGKVDAAEKIIVSRLMNQPADADLVTFLAEVRLVQGRAEEALRLAGDAEQIGGPTALRSQIAGLANGATGHLTAAEKNFRRAVELDPKFVPAHYYLARLLYTRNRFDEAIEESKAAIALSPDLVRAYENVGLCYEGQDDSIQAERWYRQAILKNSDSPAKTEWPMLDLATLLIRQNRQDEARPYLEQALALSPTNPETHLQMGILLDKGGDLQGSFEELRTAINLNPNLAGALYRIAHVCKRLGREREAQHYFDEYRKALGKKK
jgi:tetratricopeptide (TPR) repeat protein